MLKNNVSAVAVEEYCDRLKCITEMVCAVQVASAAGDMPNNGYSLALYGIYEDLNNLIDELENLYIDNSEGGRA